MSVANRMKLQPFVMTGKQIAGVMPQGEIEVWELLTGQRLQLVQAHLKSGFFHPLHNHLEHESIGFVVSGKLKMHIGGKEYALGPGDAWHHAIGVHHSTEALEDSWVVEAHVPPRAEYSGAKR